MLNFYKKIDYLKKSNISLKRSLRIKTRALKKAVELLNFHNIRHNLSLNSTQKIDIFRYRTQQKQTRSNKDVIFDCLVFNRDRPPNHHVFNKHFYEYAYSLYCQSSSCYEVIRSVLPFPCESNLRERYSPEVTKIEQRLTNPNEIETTLKIREKDFDEDIIYCTLAVDAFTVSNLMPKNKQNSQLNACFLYLLIPLNFSYKSFPLFLENTKNGNASDQTIKMIFFISNLCKKTKFKILFFSVDGDLKYDPLFVSAFNYFSKAIENIVNSCDIYSTNFLFFFDTLPEALMISDPLHIFKNFRTKILRDNTVLSFNFFGAKPINSEIIESILNLGEALTDKGSLAKMRDCHPLNIFTISNTIKLFYKSNKDDFLFLFLVSVWNECLLNDFFSLKLRTFLLEIVLRIFIKIERYMKVNLPGKFIGYRKSDNKPYVFFVSPTKIKRIILTLLGQMAVLLKKNPKFALDRAGSHVEENFIGTIRDLCDGDNRYSTILHNLARFEYIIRYSENQFYKPKAKRLNLGGVHIKVDGFDTTFEYNPKIISENLFDLMVNNNCDHQVISHLISKLEIISSNCVYRKFHTPAITSNADIINRLISLRISSKKEASKTFSEGEANYIDRILLYKIDHNDQNLAQLFQCTVEEIIKFKELRKSVLSKRPWSKDEEYYLFLQMGGYISLTELKSLLICRVNEDIEDKKNKLKRK